MTSLYLALSAALAVAPISGPEITVYNQGFGFVKEVRELQLKAGRQTIEVQDVAAQIEPTSVGIRSLTDPKSFEVLEQNYQYDLINSQAILNKSVGKRIRFVRTIGNQKDVLTGILMSSPTAIVGTTGQGGEQTYNGMVIKTDDGRIVLDPTGEVEVESVPDGLISMPTLLWDLEAVNAGPNQIQLSYLTQGMNWNADYVLNIDDHGKADMKGWVTIDNRCGATFKDAKLKLLAGDVQRVAPAQPQVVDELKAADLAPAAKPFQEQALFEYHLYTLQRPATIRNNEIKQLSLMEGHGISYDKVLIVDSMEGFSTYYPGEGEVGTGTIKPQVRIEFTNSEANGLGMPLPKGNVKVYQTDSSGSAQMLGEAAIDHTPKNEKLSIVVGRSFDVRANRKRTNYHAVSARESTESFEIEVRNQKAVPQQVRVMERHWGDWSVIAKSMPFTKLDANTMEFVVDLKAGEKRTVTYTVDTRW